MLLPKFLQHQLQCQLCARLKGGVQKILWLKNETIKGIFEAAVKIANSQLLQSVMITKLDLRKSAPFATVMDMLLVDKGEALAVEMDMAEEPGLAGVATMALLTGFKKDYMIPQAAGISAAAMTEAPHKNASEEGGSSSSRKKGRCLQLVKSTISHVADQIAQFQLSLIICLGFKVPIVSKVKCVSIKGKGLMWLRAPPTDCIWFAFKEMPDLVLVTEPAIGDCCINSGCVLDAFVEQWRESAVLPNCQSISVCWMMGEDDD
ncbi:unnamed protein product [Sphagnum balticum]